MDTNNCEEILGYANVSKKEYLWKFEVRGFRANDKHIDGPRTVLSDTGNSFLRGPNNAIQNLAKALGAREFGRDKWLIKCDVNTTISLELDGFTLDIPIKELIQEIGWGKNCRLRIISGGRSMDYWNIGSGLMRSYCVIHNVVDRSLGFAKVTSTHGIIYKNC